MDLRTLVLKSDKHSSSLRSQSNLFHSILADRKKTFFKCCGLY